MLVKKLTQDTKLELFSLSEQLNYTRQLLAGQQPTRQPTCVYLQARLGHREGGGTPNNPNQNIFRYLLKLGTKHKVQT